MSDFLNNLLGTRPEHQPTTADEEQPRPPRGREAERLIVAEAIQALRHAAQTMTEFAARLQGQVVNNVLESGTRILDASGTYTTEWQAAGGCVYVRNLGTHPMTVTSRPVEPGGTAPSSGTGIWILPAGAADTVPLASRTMTVYGTTGDQVGVQVYTTSPAPNSSLSLGAP